jgi:site-specific DNA-cytosine methylase
MALHQLKAATQRFHVHSPIHYPCLLLLTATLPQTHPHLPRGGAREWVRASSISRASFKVVQAFVLAKANKGDIPQPGDVDVVAGGPPCQVRQLAGVP